MPVNAILFCHFVNLNTLFLTVLCILLDLPVLSYFVLIF